MNQVDEENVAEVEAPNSGTNESEGSHQGAESQASEVGNVESMYAGAEVNNVDLIPERAAQDSRDQEVQSDETEEQQAPQITNDVERDVEITNNNDPQSKAAENKNEDRGLNPSLNENMINQELIEKLFNNEQFINKLVRNEVFLEKLKKKQPGVAEKAKEGHDASANEENGEVSNDVERVIIDRAVNKETPQLENKSTQTQLENNEISTQTEVKSFETFTQTEVESREISTSTEAPQLETSCSQTDLKHFEIITPTKRISPAAHVKAAAVSVDSDAAVTSQPDSETGESSPARKRKKPALTTGFILNSSDEDSDAEDRRSRLDALCAQDSYEKQKK